MRVLIVNGFDPADTNHQLVDTAEQTLADIGHEVNRVDLVAEGFAIGMSPAERAAYHDDNNNNNLITPEVERSARLVQNTDALLFCYPTILHTVPAVLKGWCERVLIPGVAFVFDEKGRVSPGMDNVMRLAAITVTPHHHRSRLRHGDLGHRTVLRSLRLNCNRRCRRTYIRLASSASIQDGCERIQHKLSRW